jgi:hypothetical protein
MVAFVCCPIIEKKSYGYFNSFCILQNKTKKLFIVELINKTLKVIAR